MLVDKSGKVTGLVIGVGGFLGAGEKDVIVPFTAVKTEKKNDKWWLTLDQSKDDLKSAPGFKYHKASTTWVPEKKRAMEAVFSRTLSLTRRVFRPRDAMTKVI